MNKTKPMNTDTPRKAQLFKTARATIGCRAFKAGDIVSIKWFHRGSYDWYLVNGDEIAYPEIHLTDFVL
jgi:hypothetical protein